MDVEVVRLPEGEDRWCELRQRGKARLALLEPHIAPLTVNDPLEDWVRLPATDADIRARIVMLERSARSIEPALPHIDEDDRLHVRDRWVALPPIEARLMEGLIDRVGVVASRSYLAAAAWGGEHVSRNALDTQMLRLRKRVDPLGLSIRTVRSRGYVLEAA